MKRSDETYKNQQFIDKNQFTLIDYIVLKDPPANLPFEFNGTRIIVQCYQSVEPLKVITNK
jgi:hypothetical protein